MAARITIERILRDDEDVSGQSIREWKIEREDDHITIRHPGDREGFLLIRVADIDIFVKDLQRAKVVALDADR